MNQSFRLGQLLAYVVDIRSTLENLPGYTLNKQHVEVMLARCKTAEDLIQRWATELE